MVDRWLLALRYVYALGLCGAVILAFTGGGVFAPLRDLTGDLTSALKFYGIAHMLLLLALGLKVSRPSKPLAGAKIQTAGYLHTLIGFVAALLVFNSDDAKSLSTLMVLLGVALFTSIIGWAFGSEIADAGGAPSRHGFMDERMDAVAKEFDGFAEGVRAVHAEYLAALRAAVAELRREVDTLKEAKTATDDLAGKLLPIAGLSEALLGNLRDLASKSREARDGLGETAAAARDTAKYLSESRVLIVQLERLLDLVRDRPGGTRHGGS